MSITEDIRDAVWESLRKYGELPWEDFYPEHEAYRRSIQKVCGEQFNKLVRDEWKQRLNHAALVPCVAVLYVNSRILRARIPCPCRPFMEDDSTLARFFSEYKDIVLNPQDGRPKTVLPHSNGRDKDHFLGLIGQRIIANASPLNVSVLNSVNIPDPTGVSQLIPGSLQIISSDLQHGRFIAATEARIKSWFQGVLENKGSFKADDFLGEWLWWGRLIGPPVQFLTGKNARVSGEDHPADPFYPDDFSWLGDDKWRAVHYLYLAENPPIGFSAGCTVMLLEHPSNSPVAPLSDAIIDFAASIQRNISWGIGHTIARIEDSLGERRRNTPEKGYSISYPSSFVVQKSRERSIVKPSMPMCDAIREVATTHPNQYVRQIFASADVQFILRALDYLVDADETLTTGYEEITLPMLHSVEQLWFYWKLLKEQGSDGQQYQDVVADVNIQVRAWRAHFEDYLKEPNREPTDFTDAQLLQILRTALGAEADLSELPKYREHFVHSFHVFGLGLLFIAALSATGNRLKIESIGDARRILQTWYLTAFWHDIAYSVEKMEDLSNRYLGALRRMAPKGFDQAKEQLSMNPNFGQLLAIQSYFQRLPDIDADYLRPVVMFLFDSDDSLNKLSVACRKQLVKHAQHGVLSALVFLNESHSVEPAKQAMEGFGLSATDIGAAALAILLHHADGNWFSDKSGTSVFKKVRSNPWSGPSLFVNLLMLCDSIAQWGRNFEHAKSEKCKLDDLKMDFSAGILSICLRYPECKKDKYKPAWYLALTKPISRKTGGAALLKFTVYAGKGIEESNLCANHDIKDGTKS